MKFKTNWSNWKVFGVSLLVAGVLAVLTERFYEDVFGPAIGSLLDTGFPDEITTFSGAFMLMYILAIAFFYNVFSEKLRAVTLTYFLIVPFVLFLSSGKHLLIAVVMLIIGLSLGFIVKRTF